MIASVSGSDRSIAGAAARLAVHADGAAQGIDLALDHVHAHAASRDIGDLLGGGEAGQEDQREDLALGELGVGGHQAAFPGLRQDGGGVQSGAVVDDGDHHVGPLVRRRQRDGADRRLA